MKSANDIFPVKKKKKKKIKGIVNILKVIRILVGIRIRKVYKRIK